MRLIPIPKMSCPLLLRFILGFPLFFLSGCASSSHERSELDPATMKLLDEALEDLGHESYNSASYKLEQLIKTNPVTEMDLVILYNSGVAQEGMKNCELAQERYRSVARIANERFDKITSLALYRLGFVYDCLGKPKESVVAFLDARKKAQNLPPEVATAELPARLAAGYSSLGRQKEALHYFNEASAGLKRLLARAKGKEERVFAASTLYAMGRLSKTSEPLVFVRMLSMQQPFLLQATELSSGESSDKAERELLQAYRMMLGQKFSSKEEEREFYLESLKATRQLQKIRHPASKNQTEALFKTVNQAESILQTRLAQTSKTLEKTPQEQQRESLKKEVK